MNTKQNFLAWFLLLACCSKIAISSEEVATTTTTGSDCDEYLKKIPSEKGFLNIFENHPEFVNAYALRNTNAYSCWKFLAQLKSFADENVESYKSKRQLSFKANRKKYLNKFKTKIE